MGLDGALLAITLGLWPSPGPAASPKGMWQTGHRPGYGGPFHRTQTWWRQ